MGLWIVVWSGEGWGGILEKEDIDFRIVATHKLKVLEGAEDFLLFVDNPVVKKDSSRETELKSNVASLLKMRRFLKKGGHLAVFPAGEASDYRMRDYPWRHSVTKITKYCDYVVPLWVSGPGHTFLYDFLDIIKPSLRGAVSLREAWKMKGKKVVLNIGKSISTEDLKLIGENGEVIKYLREKSEELAL